MVAGIMPSELDVSTIDSAYQDETNHEEAYFAPNDEVRSDFLHPRLHAQETGQLTEYPQD